MISVSVYQCLLILKVYELRKKKENFYFQSHGQLSLYKFSNTHAPIEPHTNGPTPGKLAYRGGAGPPKNDELQMQPVLG